MICLSEIYGGGPVKFRLSERHTKICEIFLMVCTFTIVFKRPNHEEDFFKFFVLFRKSELYQNHS